MTKKGLAGIVLTVLLLALFSAIFFSLPMMRTRKFWFAYFCGILAIAYQIYSILIVYSSKYADDRFYGFPLERLGIYYLLLQLGAIAVELTADLSGWAMLLMNALLLAFPVTGVITTRTVQAELARHGTHR